MNQSSGCDDCEAAALLRVLAVQELLGFVLWAECDPLGGVESAISALQRARNELRAAGYEAES